MPELHPDPSPEAPAAELIRVLVVDDHALFRRGLQMVLEQESDIEVVGEAGDGAGAVQIAAQTLPDIVLMDVRMPHSGGIEALTALHEIAPLRADHHADHLGRGGRPLRGAQGRRDPATCSRRSRSTRWRPPYERSTAASR